MPLRTNDRIMMISTHGYVAANPELGKPDTGGQVVYVLELSKSLARLGYRVDILTRRFENQPTEETVAPRVRVLRFPCGGKEFIGKEWLHEFLPEWVNHVERFIQKKRLNYAFIDSHYWDAGLAGISLATRLGIPHLHTPHSIGAWKRMNMAGEPAEMERKYNFARRIREEKIIYDESDLVIATTAQQRDNLRQGDYDVPLEKIRVVPPGYDDTRFYPVSTATRMALKEELNLQGQVVMAIGRIAKNKGYDLLLRAMPVVFRRLPEARLFLAIGSKEPNEQEQAMVQELKDLARSLEIESRVMFSDYLTDEALPDYYRAADVFALSSRYEPFGMTAIEAMACGTPTVITTEGGLWEEIIWGIEGIYADPNDPEAFGHAIYNVLKYPRIAAHLSKLGSHKARARFTWTGIAQQILGLLESVPARLEVHVEKKTREPIGVDEWVGS